MSSRNLVICDSEAGYAARLAAFLSEKKELAFQVKIYSSLKQMYATRKSNPVDLLLVGGTYSREQLQSIGAGRIIRLTADAKEASENEEVIFKYQSGDEIYAQIVKVLAKEESGEFLHIRKKEKGQIIGIYSPVHRIGQTTFAIAKGKELARDHNVLYLNLEMYAGLGGHFPEERPKNLSGLLYYAKQERGNLGLLLTTLVKRDGGLDYVPPVVTPEDIKAVGEEEWMSLFYDIMEQSIYDTLILDLSDCVQGLYDILKKCTTIYLPVADDRFAAAKLRQYEESLWQLGYGEVWERMIRCDTGRTAS